MILPGTALADKLSAALADLGDTPATVAAVLQAQGCVGWWRCPEACPVARYIQRILGAGWRASVVQTDVSVWPDDGDPLTEAVVIPLPGPVQAVVRGFDQGRYPALGGP